MGPGGVGLAIYLILKKTVDVVLAKYAPPTMLVSALTGGQPGAAAAETSPTGAGDDGALGECTVMSLGQALNLSVCQQALNLTVSSCTMNLTVAEVLDMELLPG